ncbi:MAG TPA: CBS domain-containing protein, partial [Candidatus Limnocylindria bacterium]
SGGERQRAGVARALAAEPPVMLMDEPFGAVDPILRDRLQNEFLRLQEQVRKTIVFVTHDVDEAIKMADRIAILQRGGVLAQCDTPEAILTAPASDFVAHFVGADRGLKRLSLARVRDLPLEAPLTARLGEPRAELLRRMGEAAADYALLLDADERPIGWMSRGDLAAEGAVVAGDATPGSPTLQPESTLRDALSTLLGSSVQLGVVVDRSERVVGVISVDAISDVLRAAAPAAPAAPQP